ncbi:winged helix-turn-helix domain-containing protein [Streptomyces sp900105245]|uniref:Winged helix-turn-helix domain-containing protein n=1 Tax=Streptomyces sp. 900105245 TaxID=3154379 RepID=A0ABV1UKX8_9ACTN
MRDGGGLTPAGRQRRETVGMQAAELFEKKIKPREVARRLRVSVKSAYQWHQLWRDGRVSGAGAGRAWLGGREVWTASRVARLIGRKFHVAYSVSDATRLMHRRGFSPQVASETCRRA